MLFKTQMGFCRLIRTDRDRLLDLFDGCVARPIQVQREDRAQVDQDAVYAPADRFVGYRAVEGLLTSAWPILAKPSMAGAR